MIEAAGKPYRGISMEGRLATWYAKLTHKDIGEFERLAREIATDLPSNARVLEIAPGPGYLSVALAKLGPFKITGLDISQTFVRMAADYAKREGVTSRFIHGSASDIPLENDLFDLIVCRAAFKNFSQPLKALNEMHRVLKPAGQAIVIDLRKDTSWDEIVAYVNGMKVSPLNNCIMKLTFKHMLLKRAYTEEQMAALARASNFKFCQIIKSPVGMEVRLVKNAAAGQSVSRFD